jgi:hypothetical protein
MKTAQKRKLARSPHHAVSFSLANSVMITALRFFIRKQRQPTGVGKRESNKQQKGINKA